MSYLGNNPNKGSFFQQKFTGDGSATTFTLLQSVTDGSQLIVTIGNVIQEEGSSKAYTASGSTLTFDSAPANGDIIVVRYLGRSLDTPTSYATQITFKYVATNGQTAFTGADANGLTLSYSLGSVDVYLNGVHLDSTDFTETNESTLTLTSGATTNDELVIVAKRTITLADVVSKSNGGTFAGAVSFGGGISGITGDLSITNTADGGANLNLISNDHGDASDFSAEGFINFIADNDADQQVTFGRIGNFPADVSDGTEDGRIRIDLVNNGTMQGAIQIGSGYLFLVHDQHVIEWHQTRGTNFNIGLATTTPTANRVMYLPDANGTLVVNESGTVTITDTDAGSSEGPTINLTRNSASPAVNDLIGSISFNGEDSGSNPFEYGRITGIITDPTNGSEDGLLRFQGSGNGSLFTAYQIGYGGNFFYRDLHLMQDTDIFFEGSTDNEHETQLTVTDPTADRTITLPDATGTVLTTGNSDTPATTSSSSEVDHVLVNDGGVMKKSTIANLGISSGASLSNDANNRVTTATGSGGINGEANFTWNGNEAVMNRGNGTGGIINFKVNGTQVGNIAVFTSGSTSFSSTSDYRLKENVNYSFDATTRLKKLKPCRFNFIADETNTLQDGFLAHEVSSVVPQAIIGEKDEVDSDGNIVAQSIDQSKLIPLLVKTIQELEARITELEK